MKFKKEIPNKYEYMRKNTVEFLENEKVHAEIAHEKNIGRTQNLNDERIHKGKEIKNTIEYMKGNVHNFIQNETIFSEITHENNVGKIKYKLNIVLEDDNISMKQKSTSNSQGHIATVSTKVGSNMDEIQQSRVVQNVDTEHSDRRSETMILTKSRLDYSGSAPKRYTTTCFIKPAPVPTWYTESLTLKIGSTKRTYKEHVYFKVKMNPIKWSETMTTEVKTCPKLHFSQSHVPVKKSDVHYISLEPQQISVK